jgi:hypothetical protein
MSASLFFRVFSHLLPDSLALRIRQGTQPWKIGDGSKVGDTGLLVGGKFGASRTIDRFWYGFAYGFADARKYAGNMLLDLYSNSTRDLDEWEYQYGLPRASATNDRRANVLAAHQSTGGQGPDYLQAVVQAAGFPLYIHEWFDVGSSGSPLDPRSVTVTPRLGRTRCGGPRANCGDPDARCDSSLANNPLYIVNKQLLRIAPPSISNDPSAWPKFLYWGAEIFPGHASVPAARRAELERLLLKICPMDQWLVVLVDYT